MPAPQPYSNYLVPEGVIAIVDTGVPDPLHGREQQLYNACSNGAAPHMPGNCFLHLVTILHGGYQEEDVGQYLQAGLEYCRLLYLRAGKLLHSTRLGASSLARLGDRITLTSCYSTPRSDHP